MKKISNKTIWSLFLLSSIIIFTDIFFIILKIIPPTIFDKLKLYFPPFVVFIFILHVMNVYRGLLFMFIASVTGFVFEFFGTRYGQIFGAGYHYNLENYDLDIFHIPFVIMIYWTLFIYTGYALSNSFCLWRGKEKPNKINKNKKTLLKMILLDSYIIVGIDFFMDPIMVSLNNWNWHNTGSYYNIPFPNFIGWFIVAFLASSMFRVFEYFYPEQIDTNKNKLYLMPSLGYISLFLLFTGMAVKEGIYSLVLWGMIFMLPIIVSNLYCWHKRDLVSTI